MGLSDEQLLTAEQRREQLIKKALLLPEVILDGAGESHLAFRIRKKIFAYYLFDHHGDGKIALCCKSTLHEQRRLIRNDPESFFVPAYLGSRGWVAVRLDLEDVEWSIVYQLLKRAYLETAPRRLAALVDVEV